MTDILKGRSSVYPLFHQKGTKNTSHDSRTFIKSRWLEFEHVVRQSSHEKVAEKNTYKSFLVIAQMTVLFVFT